MIIETSKGPDRQIALEVEAAYRRYIIEYPAALWRYVSQRQAVDYAVLDFWAFPLLFVTSWSNNTGVAIVDLPRFDSMVRGLYDQYYVDGWAGGIELDEAKVSVASPTIAVIETRGTRYRADGSMFNTWNASYSMRSTTRGWKHFAVFDTTEPRPSHHDWVSWFGAVSETVADGRSR